jgi:outer membrane lipoprotein-sorting protein
MMRKLVISASLLAGVFSLLSAQSLEAVLQTHYKAASQEKMEKIKTIRTTGKNSYSMAGIESGFTMFQARPNKLRIEAEMQGSKLVQTYNGETGWMYAPAMGIAEPKELSDQELESILGQAEFENPLWNYQEKGHILEWMGSTEDGREDQLKLTRENGDVLNFFISKDTHLITTITSTQLMGGSEQDIEIDMKDYKKVKGIPVAHYIATKIGGQIVYTITIEEVEYNKDMDPAIFEKPAAE